MRITPVIFIFCILILSCAEHSSYEPAYLSFQPSPPGNSPRLFAPDHFAPLVNYRDAAFTPDGKEFYFTRIRQDTFTIMECRYVNGKWSAPEPARFSGNHNDFEPCISADGKFFYFASMRPSELKPEMKNDIDIWRMEKTSDGWSQPELLDTVINSTCMEYFPSVTSSGDLYFGRNNQKMTRGDIYVSRFQKGKFTKAQKLPATVNLPATSYNACIAPDESYILFSTYIQENGPWHSDLFISFRGENGWWSEAINMGSQINSPGNDHAPSFSPDGKYLFFASTRGQNSNDKHRIYWISTNIINQLKKQRNEHGNSDI